MLSLKFALIPIGKHLFLDQRQMLSSSISLCTLKHILWCFWKRRVKIVDNFRNFDYLFVIILFFVADELSFLSKPHLFTSNVSLTVQTSLLICLTSYFMNWVKLLETKESKIMKFIILLLGSKQMQDYFPTR